MQVESTNIVNSTNHSESNKKWLVNFTSMDFKRFCKRLLSNTESQLFTDSESRHLKNGKVKYTISSN